MVSLNNRKERIYKLINLVQVKCIKYMEEEVFGVCSDALIFHHH